MHSKLAFLFFFLLLFFSLSFWPSTLGSGARKRSLCSAPSSYLHLSLLALLSIISIGALVGNLFSLSKANSPPPVP